MAKILQHIVRCTPKHSENAVKRSKKRFPKTFSQNVKKTETLMQNVLVKTFSKTLKDGNVKRNVSKP